MLSWEYPPRIVGGLARHVAELSRALSRLELEDEPDAGARRAGGIQVDVVTWYHSGTDLEEVRDGVRIHRARCQAPGAVDFLESVLQMNLEMLQTCLTLMRRGYDFDVIHAHDWIVGYAAKCLKHAWRKPLIATVHATEYGRNGGLYTSLQNHISDMEWWLCYEAWRVICCSDYMRQEVERVFQVPNDKIRVIPNGLDVQGFDALIGTDGADLTEFRRRYAADDERIVYFIGRLVREKGAQYLVEAAPRVLSRFPRAKFVIAGSGPMEQELKQLALERGVYHKIYFTGYIDDAARRRLYACADVCAYPSLYEPFGIVALEGMAAGRPVVVTDTGGFRDIVRAGEDGLLARPGDADSLSEAIVGLLSQPALARSMGERGRRRVIERFSWNEVARRTISVYSETLEEWSRSPWRDEIPGPASSSRGFGLSELWRRGAPSAQREEATGRKRAWWTFAYAGRSRGGIQSQ